MMMDRSPQFLFSRIKQTGWKNGIFLKLLLWLQHLPHEILSCFNTLILWHLSVSLYIALRSQIIHWMLRLWWLPFSPDWINPTPDQLLEVPTMPIVFDSIVEILFRFSFLYVILPCFTNHVPTLLIMLSPFWHHDRLYTLILVTHCTNSVSYLLQHPVQRVFMLYLKKNLAFGHATSWAQRLYFSSKVSWSCWHTHFNPTDGYYLDTIERCYLDTLNWLLFLTSL